MRSEATGFEDRGWGHQLRNVAASANGKGGDTDLPWSLRGGTACRQLASVPRYPFPTSDLQNYKIVNLCGFKPLNGGDL